MNNLAELFAEVFSLIDDHVEDDDARYELSKRFWSMTREHDFEYGDMDCDEVLVHLGLARIVPDPEYPGEVVTVYDGGV